MKKICDSCLVVVGIDALETSVLGFDCKVDGLDPSLLDGWVKVDAVVEGKCFEEAQAARSDEFARRLV